MIYETLDSCRSTLITVFVFSHSLQERLLPILAGEEGDNIAIPRPFTRAVIVQLLDVALRPLGGKNNTVMAAIEVVSLWYSISHNGRVIQFVTHLILLNIFLSKIVMLLSEKIIAEALRDGERWPFFAEVFAAVLAGKDVLLNSLTSITIMG